MDAVDQLLFAGRSNPAQHASCHLAEKRLHQIQPRAMGGQKHEIKTLRPALQISLGLFGDVRGVVVHDEADAHFFRVLCIQLFQQRDEVPAVVGIADNLCDPTCVQIQSRQQRDRPQSLVFIVALVTGMSARSRRPVRAGRGQGLDAGFFILGNGHHRRLP